MTYPVGDDNAPEITIINQSKDTTVYLGTGDRTTTANGIGVKAGQKITIAHRAPTLSLVVDEIPLYKGVTKERDQLNTTITALQAKIADLEAKLAAAQRTAVLRDLDEFTRPRYHGVVDMYGAPIEHPAYIETHGKRYLLGGPAPTWQYRSWSERGPSRWFDITAERRQTWIGALQAQLEFRPKVEPCASDHCAPDTAD